MEKYARTLGPGIHDDGIRKVLAGLTTVEELFAWPKHNGGFLFTRLWMPKASRKGRIEADSARQIRAQLRDKGWTPLSGGNQHAKDKDTRFLALAPTADLAFKRASWRL